MVEHTAENTVPYGANSYVQKFCLNPTSQKFPENIKHELQILCVDITEEADDVLTLEFDEIGNLLFKTSAEDGDYLFDDTASDTKIDKAHFDHQELLEELELYYRVVPLGERI